MKKYSQGASLSLFKEQHFELNQNKKEYTHIIELQKITKVVQPTIKPIEEPFIISDGEKRETSKLKQLKKA